MDPNVKNSLIEKKTLHPGKQNVTFKNGTKVFFHYQARFCDDDHTVLDDSRKIPPCKPIELVLGKKFKLEVWEVIVQKMAVGEVASFTIDKSLLIQYPFVSKTLRDATKEHKETHCCAMTLQTTGLGYDDLNQIMKDPQNLEFIIDLLKVEQPEEYEKDMWQMTEEEMKFSIPMMKEEGNELFKAKEYEKAAKLYAKAIGMLEQLMLKEKPREKDWNDLNSLKMPLLMNFAQCKLIEGDYYAVIEHCNSVLEHEPDNIKTLFRRAKAHLGAWNPKNAREDFNRVMELDPSLSKLCKQQLQILYEELKKRDEDDKEKLKNLFM